jgi:hypothetical protein
MAACSPELLDSSDPPASASRVVTTGVHHHAQTIILFLWGLNSGPHTCWAGILAAWATLLILRENFLVGLDVGKLHWGNVLWPGEVQATYTMWSNAIGQVKRQLGTESHLKAAFQPRDYSYIKDNKWYSSPGYVTIKKRKIIGFHGLRLPSSFTSCLHEPALMHLRQMHTEIKPNSIPVVRCSLKTRLLLAPYDARGGLWFNYHFSIFSNCVDLNFCWYK